MNKYIEIIIKKYPEIQPNPSTYDLRKGATGYYGLANPTIQKSQTTGMCVLLPAYPHTTQIILNNTRKDITGILTTMASTTTMMTTRIDKITLHIY